MRGNVNWMRARESQLASELFGDDLRKVLPVVQPGGSDSATFDNVLELLVLGGRSLPHAMMMMIPEATAGRDDLPPELLGFYAYHQCLMEAWDGPAAVSFTDGRVIGSTLDRNGLRPGRWLETRDGWVVLASETGRARHPGREHPPQGPAAARQALPRRPRAGADRPRRRGQARDRRRSSRTASGSTARSSGSPTCRRGMPHALPTESLRQRQIAFGYSLEDMKVILAPLARNAEEAVSSMGNDTPLAVLSDRHRLIYSYFKQLFAQVTNPPIDSIREAIVMSLQASIGSEKNLFDETPEHARQLVLETPILLDSELEQLRQVHSAIFKARTLDMTWPVAEGPAGMDVALERLCREADEALAAGINILILSDRAVGRGARAAAVAARGRRRPPPPRARGHAPPGRPRRRVGRDAQRPQRRDADRLRRRRRQPVPDARDARRARRARLAAGGHDRRAGAAAGGQGARQGAPEDALEDGDLDDPLLLRRPDLRGRGPRARARRAPLHRHRVAHRRRRHRRLRERHARPARARLPGRPRHAAARDRPLRLAARRRAPPVEPRDDRAPAGRGPQREVRDVRGVLARGQRGRRAPATRCAGCSGSARPRTAASRSRRSSRRARS